MVHFHSQTLDGTAFPILACEAAQAILIRKIPIPQKTKVANMEAVLLPELCM